MENKYVIRGRISEHQFRLLVKYLALDLDASKISILSGISRVSVNRLMMAMRRTIATECELESPFDGEVEVDESYFGPKRVKGKRGRGAGGKTIVFGLLKRQGKVYTEIVPDCQKVTLQRVIRGRVAPETIIQSDGWRGYNGLVDVGYEKHYRVHHGKNEFVSGRNHINGIESFWGYAKNRLTKFKGIRKEYFYLHLKETEFRFNHRKQNLYQALLKLFRKHPLKLS